MVGSVAQSLAQAKKLEKAGELGQARIVYEGVLERFPGNKRASAALTALEKTGSLFPNTLTAEQVNGLLHLYNQREYTQVVSRATALGKTFPNAPVIFNLLAAAQTALGQPDAAIQSYRQAITLSPEYAEAHNNLGTVLKSKGEFGLAISSYKAAIRLKPDYAEAHNNLGNALRNQGQPREALASYDQALRLKPNFVDAHSNKGNALRDLNQPEPAMQCYGAALALNPNYVQAHNNMGNALRDLKRHEDAIENYRAAVAIAPDFIDALRNLAATLQSTGDTEQAIATYMRVLEVAPSDVSAQHVLAALRGQSTMAAPQEYITNLFDDYAPRFETSLVTELGYKTPSVLKALLDAHVPKTAQFNTAVDLGCGTGLMGEALRPDVITLVGIDLSAKMVEMARGKAIYDDLIIDDLRTGLDGYAGAFDLFVAADVLVYVGALDGLFKTIQANANPHAYLLFSTEHETGAEDYKLLPSGRYAHAQNYIEQVAQQSGFDVIAFETGDLRKERDEMVIGGLYLLRAT